MSKPPKPPKEKAIRTTITLNPAVNRWAEELRIALGHNSLSDLLADLIRQKKTEQEKRRCGETSPTVYPPYREAPIMAMEEPKQVYPAKSDKNKKPKNPPGTSN